MNELLSRAGYDPAIFVPDQTKRRIAKLEALIAVAAKLQDWPLLEQAVDLKLAEQTAFAIYWHETVGRKWGGSRIKYDGPGTWSFRELEDQTGIKQQQASKWTRAVGLSWDDGAQNQDEEKLAGYRQTLILAAYRAAGLEPAENHRAEGTGENEWFTPPEYILAARNAMGGIDLDPATHPKAQATIQATRFFTKDDNGLTQSWRGRIWLNPPYAQPLIAHFIDKLVGEIALGCVKQAIVLTHNYTDTAWFHKAESVADALCFTRGRIKFVDVSGEICAPTQGQTFFYVGDRHDAFREAFAHFGFIR